MPQEDTQVETVDKIKLGDKEYDQAELEGLVGLAEKTRSLEEKYNTKLDNVWPDYGRKSNELKAAKDKISELEKATEERKPVDTDLTGELEIKKAQQAARNLDIVLKDDFDTLLNEKFRSKYMEERQAERLLDETVKLQGDIDGTDGRPKFDQVEILEHMRDTGINNPMRAYEDKYRGQVDEWRLKQLQEEKQKGGYYTDEQAGGSKLPADVRPTEENLNELIAEALKGK